MANVGNLFVNISGSSKGLTKALTSAKNQISAFDKQVSRPKGDSLRRAKGRFDAARAETGRLRTTHSGRIKKTLKKEKETRQAYRQEQRSSIIAGRAASARLAMSASLAVIGLTIAAATALWKGSGQQAKAAEEGVGKYKYMGPKGGQIMEQEIGMRLDAMRAAQDPATSSEFLAKAVQARENQAASIESGSMDMGMFWREQGNNMISTFDRVMGYFGAYGSAGPKVTGPVSTTGNTGGP